MTNVIDNLLKSRQWSTYYLAVERRKTNHLIEAGIDPLTWNIVLTLDPDLETRLPKVISAYTGQNPGSRFQAARFGRHFPLLGGENSRFEHFCVKTVDLLASLQYELDNLSRVIRSITRMV